MVAASDVSRRGQAAWLPHLVENAAYRSNIGLVNCGPTAVAVTVELFNGAGTELTSYTVTLNQAHGGRRRSRSGTSGQTSMDRGSAE